MTALSTAPAGAVAQAGEYLRHGDVDNVEQLLRFLADTFLLEGHGFEPPRELADLGVYVARPPATSRSRGARAARPGAADGRHLLLPLAPPDREHGLRRRAVRARSRTPAANALAVWSYSLRRDADGRVPALELLDGHVDALITTMLATGGSGAGDDSAEAGEGVGETGRTGTRRRSPRSTSRSSRPSARPRRARRWAAVRLRADAARRRDAGRDPRVRRAHARRRRSRSRSATPATRRSACRCRATSPDPERCARVAGLAVRHARLRHAARRRARGSRSC